jgi:hypothetical protein
MEQMAWRQAQNPNRRMATTSTAWGESMRTRHLGILQLLAFLACSVAWPAYGQTPQVELTLQCQSSAQATDLRMALKNTGAIDANLVFGITIGNGREYTADALILEVKRRDGDAVESYQYSDPGRSYTIAGRLDRALAIGFRVLDHETAKSISPSCPWLIEPRGRPVVIGRRCNGSSPQAHLAPTGPSAWR